MNPHVCLLTLSDVKYAAAGPGVGQLNHRLCTQGHQELISLDTKYVAKNSKRQGRKGSKLK